LSENAFPACKLCHAECENSIHENVSGCKLCQDENERFGRNFLSKGENLSTRTDLKTNFLKTLFKQPSPVAPRKSLKLVKGQFLKTYQTARTCQAVKLFQTRQYSQPKKKLSKPENVSSGEKYWQ
jgi:hypothetical protein